jgi:hypothetical protein
VLVALHPPLGGAQAALVFAGDPRQGYAIFQLRTTQLQAFHGVQARRLRPFPLLHAQLLSCTPPCQRRPRAGRTDHASACCPP